MRFGLKKMVWGALVCVGWRAGTAAAQAAADSVVVPETVAREIVSDLSFWIWPLGFVFACGVLLCAIRYFSVVMERGRSRLLLRTPLHERTPEEVRELLREAPESQLAGLLSGMLDVWRLETEGEREKGLGDINEEIGLFRAFVNERFEGFKSLAAFLSNSAGALGLLGTVWGIYITFKGGEMDPQKIIDGMGVALSTTGCGIVASLIIDLLASVATSVHVSLVERSMRKAEELRMAILMARGRLAGLGPEGGPAGPEPGAG